MTHREIELELLPRERAALLRWNFTPEVREQLEPLAASDAVALLADSRRLSEAMALGLIGSWGTSHPTGDNVRITYSHRDALDSAIFAFRAALAQSQEVNP